MAVPETLKPGACDLTADLNALYHKMSDAHMAAHQAQYGSAEESIALDRLREAAVALAYPAVKRALVAEEVLRGRGSPYLKNFVRADYLVKRNEWLSEQYHTLLNRAHELEHAVPIKLERCTCVMVHVEQQTPDRCRRDSIVFEEAFREAGAEEVVPLVPRGDEYMGYALRFDKDWLFGIGVSGSNRHAEITTHTRFGSAAEVQAWRDAPR